MNEQSLLAALRWGAPGALETFIRTYTAYVSAVVYRILGTRMSVEDVEEVVSDVFLATWERADRLEPGKVNAYLGAIARNKAKNKLRGQDSTLPMDEDFILISYDNPQRLLEERERADLIHTLLDGLPAPEREIFLLYYYRYQPVAEIAHTLALNESTVKTKLRRGRMKLRALLTEGGYLCEAEDY